ncbi:susD family protein, partial [Bacteroides fragilis str. S24L34]
NEAINSKALSESSTPGYINLWAAKALLSRVYLTQGDNQKSLDVAEDIIKNSPYKLWKNEEYVGAWSKISGVHSNEMLFEIAITGSTDWTDREGIAYLYNEDGYADIIATKKFLDLLNEDPDDVRLGVFLAPTTKDFKKLYGTNTVFLNKYPADGLSDLRYNNVPLVRLSEVYLNAAEAAAKLGNQNDKAVEYLDAIVKRANPNKTVKGTTVTVDRVLLERRKELIGEGHRFFDAMRNNETVIRYTSKEDQGWQQALKEEARSFNRDFYKTLLPIPQDEIDANPSMKDQQNTGY